ncbi:phage gateway protein [Limnohabitans sp.]|uniref:phage gateway protein n=1 Tax=Limnohabitans sp. TaxID=1907725 RepID=UPI00286F04E2|nr:hypothetical protein [Limnohabitans sp.]
MTDNEIATVLCSALTTAMPDVRVMQANQPTIQGAPDGIVVLFTEIHSKRVGYPKRTLTTDGNSFSESCIWEAIYQFSALSPQDPNDATLPTAKDVLRRVSWVLNGAAGMLALRQSGIAVLHIGDLQVTNIEDDQGQYTQTPSMDVTIQYLSTNNVPVSTHPVTKSNIYTPAQTTTDPSPASSKKTGTYPV